MSLRTRAPTALLAASVGYLVALLLIGGASAAMLDSSPCDMAVLFSLRSEWDSPDDSCHKKLSFELWTLMKAEGSAQSADAQYVRENCIQTQDGGLVELITPQGYAMSESLEAAPGDVVSETEHSTTYQGATATTFEAFCEDDDIVHVTRVSAHLEAHRSAKKKPRRRLQSTTSEGVQAHEVAELITGLAGLGCTRTMGEDQTVCVMSDSFDQLGFAASLQTSGDLPQVEVVKELPVGDEYVPGTDEGSAMLEIMYDIAPGATYKFNTATIGEQAFADDIGVLANEEMCDVIVDDIGYFDAPAFTDGAIAVAVDEAVDSGSLYFSSAGNSGTGYRFTSNFECATGFEAYFLQTPACGTGVASHVFQPELTGIERYFYPYVATEPNENLWLQWDAEIGATQDIWIAVWFFNTVFQTSGFLGVSDFYSAADGKAVEYTIFDPFTRLDGTLDSSYEYFIQVVHLGLEVGDLDETEFFLVDKNGGGIAGQSDAAVFGHACAANAISVAAMNWVEGDGPGGAFEDPETSPVEEFSSRGPCIVNGETRAKPVTTAADAVTTSTPDFEQFFGTSAAAPAAAAIASIVRAACFPKVVGHAEMMEMLTNYDYTIDLTSDAGGAAETWGADGGYGIISASQMLAWVAENCFEACGGAPPPSPTEQPVAPTAEPITAPTPEEPEIPAPEESEDGYVEAGTKTTVSVTATAYDKRPGTDNGCGEDGCLPELAHDGIGEEDVESRWSCSKDIVPDGGQCEIEFTFGSPQDIVDVEVDFWKGDERKRTLKVRLNGDIIGKYDSRPGSFSTSLGIKQDGVESVTLESIGIDEDEWISLLEVRIMVEP